MRIRKIHAKEILDSRGEPTVEVDAYTKYKGRIIKAREMVPSGASTGKHEALELRDGGKRFFGKGARKAVSNVNKKIRARIIGLDCTKQKMVDKAMIELDGTKNKSNLGANAILGTSLACARLGSKVRGMSLYKYLGKIANTSANILPVPFMNVVNGGKHAQGHLQFQEYMIAPMGKTFRESLQIGAEVYHELRKVIARSYGKAATNVGDEGGFAPDLKKVHQPLDLITKAVRERGYEKKVKFALDIAASEFYHNKKYFIDGKLRKENWLFDLICDLAKTYPIISIEDPFDEEHFDEFRQLTKKLKKIQIVGDDLLVTNISRIKTAIRQKACNCLLLKVNQIGTLTEAIDAAKLAKKNKWDVMVSHRSGETEDSFIADLAVGLNCGQIKAGAPCRGERTAKYNQLLRIEEELGRKAKYARKWFKKL